MNPLQSYLSEVRARLKDATPGPWNAYDWPSFPRADEAEGCVRIENKHTITAFCFSGAPNNDALLIASAPTDLAKLVEALTVADKFLDQMLNGDGDEYDDHEAAVKAKLEIERIVKGEK